MRDHDRRCDSPSKEPDENRDKRCEKPDIQPPSDAPPLPLLIEKALDVWVWVVQVVVVLDVVFAPQKRGVGVDFLVVIELRT